MAMSARTLVSNIVKKHRRDNDWKSTQKLAKKELEQNYSGAFLDILLAILPLIIELLKRKEL